MENKKIELPQTIQALAELSATTAALTAALKTKQAELRIRLAADNLALAQKEQSLADLQKQAAATLQGIDGIISQRDNVLENNGTGNDNN